MNQLKMITAILEEIADQGYVEVDQESMNAIIRNVDNLIKELDEITKEDDENTDTK